MGEVQADLVDATVNVQYAVYANDLSAIEAAELRFEQLSKSSSVKLLASYYHAYAAYRAGTAQMNVNKKAASAALKRCVERSGEAVKLDETFAEALALNSSCYGMLAGLAPLKAVIYGRKASRAMQRALELQPENPRIVLLDGISDYFRPKLFGGDPGRAEEKFFRAAELYKQQDRIEPGYPEWGEAEAYAFLGEYYLGRDDLIRARNVLEQALLIAPDYRWANDLMDRVRSKQ